MSWETFSTNRYPCPCGKGEYEEENRSDDWGRFETHYTMLCPHCKPLYVSRGDPGWRLRSDLAAESNERSEIEGRAHALYGERWRSLFSNAKSKKDIWAKLTVNGKHYPSESTFYKHTRGKDIEETRRYAGARFSIDDLERVCEALGVEPDWSALGTTRERWWTLRHVIYVDVK